MSTYKSANTPAPTSIRVKYGLLILDISAPFTTIPWEFAAAFAKEMLSAVTQHGVGVALYDGFYGSPASCNTHKLTAYFATAAGENLVAVSIQVMIDRGHFKAPRFGRLGGF